MRKVRSVPPRCPAAREGKGCIRNCAAGLQAVPLAPPLFPAAAEAVTVGLRPLAERKPRHAHVPVRERIA